MNFMPRFLARFLERMTMYRLVLYFMILLLGAAVFMSTLGILPYNAGDIFFQTVLFVATCWSLNAIIARFLKTKSNVESSTITGLILASITGPLSLSRDWQVLVIIAGAAMISKYIFAIRQSHIFNPAAFGAVVAGMLGYSASWWIGNEALLPIVLIGGLLVAYKIRRVHLVLSFLVVYSGLLVLDIFFVRGGGFPQVATIFNILLFSSPLLFFSFVMLVEPLTSPQTKSRRMYFGAFTGAMFFVPQWFLGLVPFSLELSLLVGNIFSRIINPDSRQAFILRKRETLSLDIRGFWFEPTHPFSYVPGQYLEYTFAHPGADSRGIRRYFTIASAPHEKQVLLATRFSEPGSSFKKVLREMKEGDEVIASKVAGEFILPSDAKKKLVFIAGGIGITPFRSMAKHILARGEHRDIILFYCARVEKDLVFKDIFEETEKISMRNVYVLSDKEKIHSGWNGKTGVLDAEVIKEEVRDAKERIFYISGPEPMVKSISTMLVGMGIPKRQILRDYFPGYDADGESAKS